jgi:predicted GNAT superfamily acetyltransferase
MAADADKSIEIRDITNVREMRLVEEMEKEVWGIEDIDVVPVTHLVAALHAGGILIGAFEEKKLAGFAYGFVGYEGGHVTIHSHMLAVKSGYRNHNLGLRLKLAQRERALKTGITRITWTFDPLQCLNAHFNFAKLGVLSDSYRIDFYGESTSFLHRTGTDRLWVTWLLASRRVGERIDQPKQPIDIDPDREMRLIQVSKDDSPARDESREALSCDRVLIEIPADIVSIERSDAGLASEWRLATRRAFTSALGAGFLVEDFIRLSRDDTELGAYVLGRGKEIEDFV